MNKAEQLIDRYLEQTHSVTPGMRNAMTKGGSAFKCASCSLKIPKYPGKYPSKCPDCDGEILPVTVTNSAILKANPRFIVELAIGETAVRTFYDSGILRVATIDDVLVEPGMDSRVDTVLHMTNEVEWPHDHPLSDFEFEGNLDDLYNKVLNLSCGEGTSTKRGTSRTTKQRTGDRKAQRTKLRRP